MFTENGFVRIFPVEKYIKFKKIIDKEEKYVIIMFVSETNRGLVKWYDRGLQNLWWEFDSLIPCF